MEGVAERNGYSRRPIVGDSLVTVVLAKSFQSPVVTHLRLVSSLIKDLVCKKQSGLKN